jgi:hypothetical protein
MRKKLWLLLCLGLSLTGCKNIVEDGEIKGILTVDKSAFGNAYLEFNDPVSRQTRFIHPGKKIIQIGRSGVSKIEIVLMDSHRVQLGKLEVPSSAYQSKGQSFFVPAKSLNQNWDLQGQQKVVLIRTEALPRTGAKPCVVSKCEGGNCKGLIGPIFEVVDYRNDYEIHFSPEGTQLVWGKFLATGELKTEVKIARASQCVPVAIDHSPSQELYE